MLHKYVLLKSSWGIVIFLEIEEILNPELNDEYLIVTNKIYLRMNPAIKYNYKPINFWLVDGVKSLSHEINNIIQDNTVCYFIKNLDFNLCDFQEEGLYCAIREWIAKYYNIEIAPLEVFFDKDKNRYIFPQLL